MKLLKKKNKALEDVGYSGVDIDTITECVIDENLLIGLQVDIDFITIYIDADVWTNDLKNLKHLNTNQIHHIF